MQFTIKDILQLFQDRSVRLAAGYGGIDNDVTSVNIMDAPDIWNWVKRGDLILTTAYTVKDDPALQERLIRELSAAGSAGLGIKTKRFLPEIPAAMKQVAEELNFPILELPVELSLAEIMNPIISSIAARQSYILQRSNEIHKALTKVAIKGGGLTAIIACLGNLIQCPVGCYDPNGHPLAHWVPDNIPGIETPTLNNTASLLAGKVSNYDSLHGTLAQAKSPSSQTVAIDNQSFWHTSFAIMSNNEFFGHISIIQPTDAFMDINDVALEHTCTVAALDFLKQKAVAESKRLYSRDILEHVLFGDLSSSSTSELISASKLLQAKHFECVVIEMDESEDEVNIPVIASRLYKITQQHVSAKFPLSLISERTGKIIALLASSIPFDAQYADLLTRLHKTFKENRLMNISIGVGTWTDTIASVRQSYSDALTCLRIGRIIKGAGAITYPKEITSYALLSGVDTSRILAQVYGSIIAKLEKSDKTHETDLLKTLEVYLETDRNLTDTAKELYIHRNTLSNRLERIIDLTGIDFNDRELTLSLRLALRQRKVTDKGTKA